MSQRERNKSKKLLQQFQEVLGNRGEESKPGEGGEQSMLMRNIYTEERERASLVAQLVKNPPAMRETWVRSLGWKDPLEKGKAIHSSILAWRILWTVQFIESEMTE